MPEHDEDNIEQSTGDEPRALLLEAALCYVPFDGWGDKCLASAALDIGIDQAEALKICPGGAADLARDYHVRGDRRMEGRLLARDLSALRFSERVAEAVWERMLVNSDHQQVVRRSTALYALPTNLILGSSLLWGTSDRIWNVLGDVSEDANWYSKRATLSGVLAATVLYWIGDQSEGFQSTRAFIDRRISDVMGFEKLKARARNNRALRPFTNRVADVARTISKPSDRRQEFPGWTRRPVHD